MSQWASVRRDLKPGSLASASTDAGLGDVEDVQDGVDAREAAGGVDRPGGGEVVEPAEELGRVGAAEGDDRRGLLERLGGLGEGAADLAHRLLARAEVDRAVLLV